MNSPKVSVVIPVYNAEKYLRQCLDSVINQTLQDIEIICVDDGSMDNSLNILNDYAEKDSRIRIATQKNLHAGVARNHGLSLAAGEYIHFLDSDDWIEQNAYEILVQQIEQTHADVCICFYEKFDNISGEKTKIAHRLKAKEYCCVTNFQKNPRHFLYNAVVPWNKIYKREFLLKNNISFDDLICSNDRSFYIHVLLCAKKIAIIDEYLIHYRVNNNSSLVGATRLNNFACHFRSYENIWELVKNEKTEIKKLILDISLRDFFAFYHKATGEQANQIREQLLNYIPQMPLSMLGDLNKFPWGIEYFKILHENSIQNPEVNMDQQGHMLIVSLTSFPARIHTVSKTIQTLLNQSMHADKTILWLAEEEFPNKENDLPEDLLALCKKGLEIHWCANIRSYKKLIPTLQLFPDAIVVTADDDNYYHSQWLERLYNAYLKNSDCIHCHRVTKFYLDANNNFQIISGGREFYEHPSYLNKQVGAGGVLYPPRCFHPDILDQDKFMSLAPTSDDIWFWLMGALAGFRVNVVEDNIVKLDYVEGTQDGPCLTKINDHGEKYFFQHFNNIINAYPQLQRRLRCEFYTGIYQLENNSKSNSSRTQSTNEKQLEKDYRRAIQRAEYAENEILLIQQSWTYKIGRFITWVPRKSRGFIRCLQENGASYTFHRILVHLHLRQDDNSISFSSVSAEYPNPNQPTEKPVVKPAKIVRDYNYFLHLDPNQYENELKLWYKRVTKEDLNLDNPQTFNEKIQWLKLYDSTALKSRLTDKYEVRKWIAEKIGENYLIPLLGVWDNFDDIDFSMLPNQFVLKANHGSGWNIIVKDKQKLNLVEARHTFNKWMTTNFAVKQSLELHYGPIIPKIIAEQYIQDIDGQLNDYKVLCFNGKPTFIWVDLDRFTDHRRNIYDLNWNLMPFSVGYPQTPRNIQAPKNLDEMIHLAEILCQGFAHVRVDFYDVNGKIYFGEMTFTSGNGGETFTPKEYGKALGDLITLPDPSPFPTIIGKENNYNI